MCGNSPRKTLVALSTNVLNLEQWSTAVWLAKAESIWCGLPVKTSTIYRQITEHAVLHEASKGASEDVCHHEEGGRQSHDSNQ